MTDLDTHLKQFATELAGTVNQIEPKRKQGTLGYEDESGIFHIVVPDGGPRVYVTIQDMQIVQAINKVAPLIPNVPVWVTFPEGDEPVVDDYQTQQAAEFFGNLPGMPVAPHSHRFGFGNVDFVESERFEPGLVTFSELGGLYVYVLPFGYRGGAFEGEDFDMTSYVPATTDTKVLVLIYLDTLTGELDVALGTEVPAASVPYTRFDIAAITVPSTAIPLMAVALYEGQTVIDVNTQIVDAREWLSATVTDDMWNPYWIENKVYVLPAGKVMHQRFLHIGDGGVLTINGLVELIGG